MRIHRDAWIVACQVLLLGRPTSGKNILFPKALEASLVLRLESDSGIQTDVDTANDEPAVLSWKDLSGHERHAKANDTVDANLQQLQKNEIEDKTRHTQETMKLPRAKRRSSAKLHDSAPALVTCPTLNVPALFFDGDDYMYIPTSLKEDPLTPLGNGFTVVAMISNGIPEEGQPNFFNHWLGLGHPGIMSESQYTLHTSGAQEDEVFGAGGKKKKKIGTPQGEVAFRVVPIMDDPDIPSVRTYAEIEGKFDLNKPTLLSFSMDGKKISGRVDGDERKFKKGGSGFSSGSFKYRGEVDPHTDAPGTPFYLGAGPSAEYLIDFTGEGAYGLLYSVLAFNKLLEPEEMKMAETYLACRFGLEDKCDSEIAAKAGIYHEEL